MNKEMSLLNIKFNGKTFEKINKIIDKETEVLETSLIAYSEMADVYTKIFKANPNINFIFKDIFGDIIIDDLHVQIKWQVQGHIIEFYFEEYWGLIELNIDIQGSNLIIKEIVQAFENYYNKEFEYSMEVKKYEDSVIFNLIINDQCE